MWTQSWNGEFPNIKMESMLFNSPKVTEFESTTLSIHVAEARFLEAPCSPTTILMMRKTRDPTIAGPSAQYCLNRSERGSLPGKSGRKGSW